MVGLANDLNIQQPGYVVHNGAGVFTGRTFQAGTGITISNPDGISGNSTISSTASLTDLHTARFIVASSTAGTGANFTTIASAIAAAQGTGINSTIFLQPGTYIENFTLPPGINLCAYTCDAFTPNVTIVGKITMNQAGTSSISGIRLQTNSANLLAVGAGESGSPASIVNLDNCYLNCTNNTGISFTSSSALSSINITNCLGELGTTGIGIFAHSSSGSLNFYKSQFGNSGGSTTANTCSSGSLNCTYSQILSPITISSTGACIFEHCILSTANLNTTMLTLGGSGVQIFRWNRIASGTASAVSISTTATLEFCTISSSNTNTITGAGTLVGNSLTFGSSSSGVNVTTQTAISVGISGSWTPNLQINSSSTGITYSSQSGGYIQIGNAVMIWGTIFLSSKGASSGNVTISNLPISVSANGTLKNIPVGEYNQLTSAGYTTLGLRLNNSTVATLIKSSASGSAVTNVIDTDISNSFQFRFSGVYITN